MKVSPSEIRVCLDIATDFAARYAAYVDNDPSPRKSRDDLQEVAKQVVGGEIGMYELDEKLEHETIVSYYQLEEDGYSILLSAGLSEEEIRYVVIKETLHILIDLRFPEYRSTDIVSHLDEMALSFLATDTQPKPPARAEYLAEIGAMEVLFPYALRKQEREVSPLKYEVIAEKYGIPQFLAERYLHPTAMAELGAMQRNGK